jgi:hypothetical protein
VARVHWPYAIQTQENPPKRGLNGRTWVDIDTNRIDMSMAKQLWISTSFHTRDGR